jgi:hypothetical protein
MKIAVLADTARSEIVAQAARVPGAGRGWTQARTEEALLGGAPATRMEIPAAATLKLAAG